MNRSAFVIILILIVAALGLGAYFLTPKTQAPVIGGDRDEHGCLGPAGYLWNEEVGACLRSFEITPDIMETAKIAVDAIGQSYALTVVSFNSYEEAGSYDIFFERGLERERKSVFIRNWQVESPRLVKLYYYDENRDRDADGNIQCSWQGLVAVEREIAVGLTPVEDTLRLLLKGDLTEQEQAGGIGTEYPLPGFSLEEVSLRDGALTLKFDDPQNRSGGGSCRVGILWFQIEATAKQFPEVKSVRFLPEENFQP